jgi:4-amino-4-deoxy-L-arabinose transferase-like glycosyltransferase
VEGAREGPRPGIAGWLRGSSQADNRRRGRLLPRVLLGLAALLLLPQLGRLDLWAPDEPRFAEVAEEMRSMRHGAPGLLVLHLNDEIYTQKPPLYYWVTAAVGSFEGHVSELAARLPSALAGVAAIAVTVALGRRLFGASSSAGLWGGAILLTVLRFAHTARRAQLDVILTLFEALSLLAFCQLELHRDDEPRRRRALLLLHGSLSLALLTKGPVGLLPLAVMAACLGWERRIADFRRLVPAWGLAISLGPALIWLAAVVALTPAGFFSDAVVDNTLGRFLAGTSHARPLYYYVYQLALDFLPWTLLWPLAAGCALRGLRSQDRREAMAWRLLVSWVGVLVIFFSLSAGKRGIYLLPIFPALALACGAGLERALEARARLPRSISSGLVIAALSLVGWGLWRAANPHSAVEPYPGLSIPVPFAAAIAATTALALALAWGRSAVTQVLATLAAVTAVELAIFHILLPSLNESKSPRPIAVEISRVSEPGEPVGIFSDRPMVAAMAYYARRPIDPLPDLASIEPFLAVGGRTIVTRARDLAQVQRMVPVEITASLRADHREVLVVRAVSKP